MTNKLKLIIIVVCFALLTVVISGSIIGVNNTKINKDYIKIDKHNTVITKVTNKVDSLENLLSEEKEALIALEQRNTELLLYIEDIEKIKTTKKDGVIIKNQIISTLSVNELDSFFADRFNTVSKNSID